MEAKDTVIQLKAVPKEIFDNQKDTIHTKMCYVAGWKDGTEAQAEISFKAGEVEMAIRLSQPHWQAVQDAKLTAIKEVVEWVDDHPLIYSPSGKDFSQIVDEWQAQKKVWGIKQ